MCRGDITATPATVDAEVLGVIGSSKPSWHLSEWFFAMLTAILAGVIVFVGIGLARGSPELLSAYVVVVGPAFLATAIRVGARSAKGQKVGWAEGLATFFVSGAIVITVIFLVGVSLLIGLFVMCLTGL
jgi:hypothetical protein